MKRIAMNRLLRGALVADAIASGTLGALLAALPAMLASLFSLPGAGLRYVGLFLIGYAAAVGALATRQRPLAILVWAVVIGNALWLIDSILVVAGAWVAPTSLGYAFVVAQALAVGVFAELQFVGLRRAVPLAAAAS